MLMLVIAALTTLMVVMTTMGSAMALGKAGGVVAKAPECAVTGTCSTEHPTGGKVTKKEL